MVLAIRGIGRGGRGDRQGLTSWEMKWLRQTGPKKSLDAK